MSLWKAVAEGQSHRYPIPGKGKGFGSVAALAPLDLRKQLWDGRKQLAQQLDRQQTTSEGLAGLHSTIMHTYSFTELKTNPPVTDLVLWGLRTLMKLPTASARWSFSRTPDLTDVSFPPDTAIPQQH